MEVPSKLPNELPVLRLRGRVLFPGMAMRINAVEPGTRALIEDLVQDYSHTKGGALIGVVAAPADRHDEEDAEEGDESADEGATAEGMGSEDAEREEGEGCRVAGGDGAGVGAGEPREPQTLAEGVYGVGTVARVVQLGRLSRRGRNVGYTIHVQGLARMRIARVLSSAPYMTARVALRPSRAAGTAEARALSITVRRAISDLVAQATELAGAGAGVEGGEREREPRGAEGAMRAKRRARRVLDQLADGTVLTRLQATGARPGASPGAVADLVGAALDMPLAQRQRILEAQSVPARLRLALLCARRQLEVLSLSRRIQEDVARTMRTAQRRYLLEEQMRAIRRELRKAGVGDAEIEGEDTDVGRLRARLEAAQLTAEARKVADTELARLARMPAHAPEYQVLLSYLELLADLPWGRRAAAAAVDVARARAVLDEDHHGLEGVKRRVLEHLAVAALREDARMPILCLLGPPGVGKTSIARSIARALGRPFRRVSLGGVRDEAEIRGHRRTYIGAMPGLLVQHLRKAGACDPVLLLDEVDKVGRDALRGDPASALLEALDREQNAAFTDHYLGTPFDLSRVFFIATANYAEGIPPPLMDRMEVIRLDGYTHEEKVEIARRHIVPREAEEHALGRGGITFSDAALREIVVRYTREAGVRELQRRVAAVCRHAAVQRAEAGEGAGGGSGLQEVTPELVASVLGPPRHDAARVDDRMGAPGVAIGLAWTPVGGRILFVETAMVPRAGSAQELVVTGSAGEVMQESARAALSWVRSQWEGAAEAAEVLAGHAVHVHLPEGAVGKDGPSAGVPLVAALVSLVSGRRVRADTAATGEVTLAGRVLAVGGIKQKVLGAHLAGVRRVVLPRGNRRDVEDIPERVRAAMEFCFVERVGEALGEMLVAGAGEGGWRDEEQDAAVAAARGEDGAVHMMRSML